MAEPVRPADALRRVLRQADALAQRHALPAESLPLGRTHGRVLASDLVIDGRSVLLAGQVMTPVRVAHAARHGVPTLDVVRRPTVALFTIGDHLVPPGLPCAAAQAYDATRELLMGLLRQDGLEPTAWPRLAAEPVQIEVALRDAGCAFDLIVVCGPSGVAPATAVTAVLARFGRIDPGPPAETWAGAPVLGRLDEACVLALPDDTPSALGLYATVGRALVDGLQRRREPRPAVRAMWADATDTGAGDWLAVRVEQDDTGRLHARCADTDTDGGGATGVVLRADLTRGASPIRVWPIG